MDVFGSVISAFSLFDEMKEHSHEMACADAATLTNTVSLFHVLIVS